MTLKVFLGLGMLTASFQSSATSLATLVDIVNDGVGAAVHALRKPLWGYTETPLQQENEAFVRDLMQKMGVKKTIKLYALPYALRWRGPHCVYNRVYLDEGFMRQMRIKKRHWLRCRS